MAEVIDDGEKGLLVEPGNAMVLAHSIERLTRDEVLREGLRAAARQDALESYTWKHNAARVFNAIRTRASYDDPSRGEIDRGSRR